MSPASMTWIHIVAVTAVYWLLLIGGWYLYTTRPSAQARARERDFKSESFDDETGQLVVVYESTINVVGIALAVLGPPALLAILWLAVRGGS